MLIQEAYATYELANIFGVDPTSITRRANREGWKGTTRHGHGKTLFWSISEMHPSAREQIINAIFKQKLSEDLFTVNVKDLQGMPEEQRAIVTARASLLRFCDEYMQVTGKSLKKTLQEFSALYNLREFSNLTWVYEVVPELSERTLWRWRRDLKRGGLWALRDLRSQPSIKDTLMTKRVVRQIMADIFCFYDIAATEIFAGLQARFGEGKIPSLRSVQRFVKTFKEENKQLLLKIHNPDGWRNSCMAASGSRSEHVTRINQLWELDSSPTDILLNDGTRYTLLACIDVYSRRVMFHLARTSSSAGICLLLRKCLLAWGRPETVKMDNGQDYKSFQILQVMTALEIETDYCNPYSPYEKPHVERVFRTFQHGYVHRLPGFIGHNVTDRKAIEGRKSFAQRQGMKSREIVEAELGYSPEEFQAICDEWAKDIYGEKVHSSIKAAPNAKAHEQADLAFYIKDERALDVLLAPVSKSRFVGKKGIRFNNGNYDAAELGGLEGTEVFLRIDEEDAGFVYVFDLEGYFICKAQDPDLTGVSPQDLTNARKARQAAIMAEKEAVVKEIVKEVKPHELAELVRETAKQKAEAVQAERAAELADVEPVYVTTHDLEEAAKAARAHEAAKPSPESEEEKAMREERTRAFKEAQQEAQKKSPYYLPEDISDRDSFYLATVMDARLKDGGELAPEQVVWFNRYKDSGYYDSWSYMYEQYGDNMFEGLDKEAITAGM